MEDMDSRFRKHLKRHALAYFIFGLFLLSWGGQLFAEAATYMDDAREHGQAVASVWVAMTQADFWEAFAQSTLENWQSEWLQVATFVLATSLFVFHGSAESNDSETRMEAKLDAIARHVGLSPEEIEEDLGEKYSRQ